MQYATPNNRQDLDKQQYAYETKHLRDALYGSIT